MDQSRSLRAEALEIVQQLGLLDILQPFGEVRLVGSVALDLVVKPDIDIHLVLDKNDLLAVTKEIAGILISKEEIKEIRIADYKENNSFFIGIDRFPGKSTDWTIDFWITYDKTTAGFEETERVKRLLNKEKRKKILEFKQYYHAKGQLRYGLSSEIYRAVVDEGVASLDDFQNRYKEELRRIGKVEK